MKYLLIARQTKCNLHILHVMNFRIKIFAGYKKIHENFLPWLSLGFPFTKKLGSD